MGSKEKIHYKETFGSWVQLLKRNRGECSAEDVANTPKLFQSARRATEVETTEAEKATEVETIEVKEAEENEKERALRKAWATVEHLALTQLESAERQVIKGEVSLKILQQVEEQCEELEKTLEEREKKKEEVLVNQPVSLQEVRSQLEEWTPALKSEYDSLRNHGAIRPIDAASFEELDSNYEQVEILPTMLVVVQKPPRKLKTRIVACGSHAQSSQGDTTAGGVDTVVVRTLTSLAADRNLATLTSDIRTAFLQAPRRCTPGRITILNPPAILKEAGCLELKDEKLEVGGRSGVRTSRESKGLGRLSQ